MSRDSERGFTLLEMVCVLALIAMMAAVLLPFVPRHTSSLSTISFFASGTSCGGAIALTRPEAGYEVRVNWLTGRIEIASHQSRIN
jgi:prepilin-type N-terminal cleavage/methylation domain-containing protein